MNQETVYLFDVWDRQTHTTTRAAQMGTRAAIRRLRGEADIDSAKVVDRAEVNAEGFYSESQEQGAFDSQESGD